MSFTADELDCLRHELCECEKEYDPSGAYSMVTAACLNCQFIDEIEQLTDALEQLTNDNKWAGKQLMKKDKLITEMTDLYNVALADLEQEQASKCKKPS